MRHFSLRPPCCCVASAARMLNVHMWFVVPCRFAKGDTADQCAVYSTDVGSDGVAIGPQAESYWLRVVPWAFYKLLKYVDDR